jgi:hypothetical protein
MNGIITAVKNFWKWLKKDWPKDTDKLKEGQDIADRTW